MGPGPHPGTGTDQSVHAPATISPHLSAPEPLPPSGRGTPRPDNPDATHFAAISEPIQAKMLERLSSSELALTPADVEANLERLWTEMEATSPATIEEGKRWYADAHDSIAEFSDRFSIPLDVGIAMTAAVSPQNEWGQNIALAEHMATLHTKDPALTLLSPAEKAYLRGKDDSARALLKTDPATAFSDLPANQAAWAVILHGKRAKLRSQIPTPKGTLPLVSFSCGTGPIAKGIDILRGADINLTLSGHKVRSFYNNLADPDNTSGRDSVTMDTHAISAASGFRMAATSKLLGKIFADGPSSKADNVMGTYPIYADAFRAVARRRSLHPHQAQASLWLYWQKVRYDYPGTSEDLAHIARMKGRFGTQAGSGEGRS